jgi:hypothetical protein
MIYEEAYKGTYPYTEMLTPSWILKRFSDSNYIWGIFESDADAPTPNEVVGCFTIVLDFERKTAYFRGMMIRPKYQKCVALREMSFAMFWNTIHVTQSRINKCYCEARTAHSITQYLAEVVSCNCHGVLLNKDQFLGRYESDAFMVGYSHKALNEERIKPKYLHPQVADLYTYVKEIYGFIEEPEITFQVPSANPDEIHKLINQAKITKNIIEFRYREITIEIPGAHLSLLYTPQIAAFEKMKWIVTSDTQFIALNQVLEQIMHELHITYCEWFIPVDQIAATEILFQNGYHALGYVPSWEKTENDQFSDCVIMARHLEFTADQQKTIQLLPQGFELLNLILSQTDGMIPSQDLPIECIQISK